MISSIELLVSNNLASLKKKSAFLPCKFSAGNSFNPPGN